MEAGKKRLNNGVFPFNWVGGEFTLPTQWKTGNRSR